VSCMLDWLINKRRRIKIKEEERKEAEKRERC
jgi:hypothetical protein